MLLIQFKMDQTGNTNEVIGSLHSQCTMEALFTALLHRFDNQCTHDVEADDHSMNAKVMFEEFRQGEGVKRRNGIL